MPAGYVDAPITYSTPFGELQVRPRDWVETRDEPPHALTKVERWLPGENAGTVTLRIFRSVDEPEVPQNGG